MYTTIYTAYYTADTALMYCISTAAFCSHKDLHAIILTCSHTKKVCPICYYVHNCASIQIDNLQLETNAVQLYMNVEHQSFY